MDRFYPFSRKQLICLGWWQKNSRYRDKTAIICDGAVRSGKTFCMSLSFVLWAFREFPAGVHFALCGKTILSLRRNVLRPLLGLLESMNFHCREIISENYVDISLDKKTLRFYLFGGKDEGSAALIQGITLGGILFDEVALMPRSFVEQGLARCSVEGSRFWFNCNPDHPYHWFYREWILGRQKKKALYVHFTMRDNPSLSKEILRRYKKLYTGVFYTRFVEGKWTAAQGLVYPMFSLERHVRSQPEGLGQYMISCDYGTVNPSSFGLWGEKEGRWYRIREYYFDSRREGKSRTDAEHYAALERLAGDRNVEKVIVDPSAASFIELIRRVGRFAVEKADNDVVNGIRRVSNALGQEKIFFCPGCEDSLREFSLYCWNGREGDIPLKENDHAMDDIRYFVSAAFRLEEETPFFVCNLRRE